MSDLTADSGGRIGPENGSWAPLDGSWAPQARQDVRDAAGASEGAVAAEVIHRCPPGWSALTPCCGQTPFELDPWSRMTVEPENVTCRPEPTAETALSGPQCPAEAINGALASTGDTPGAPGGSGGVPVPEYLATAPAGSTVILHVPSAEIREYAETNRLRELNPEVTFVVLAEDCSAQVIPGDLLASIRVTLGDVDSAWDDDTGEGEAFPDYLDRLAAGVLATVVEHYAKEEAA